MSWIAHAHALPILVSAATDYPPDYPSDYPPDYLTASVTATVWSVEAEYDSLVQAVIWSIEGEGEYQHEATVEDTSASQVDGVVVAQGPFIDIEVTDSNAAQADVVVVAHRPDHFVSVADVPASQLDEVIAAHLAPAVDDSVVAVIWEVTGEGEAVAGVDVEVTDTPSVQADLVLVAQVSDSDVVFDPDRDEAELVFSMFSVHIQVRSGRIGRGNITTIAHILDFDLRGGGRSEED